MMFRREPIHRVLKLGLVLSAFQRRPRPDVLRWVIGVDASLAAGPSETERCAFLPLERDGGVERDAIQPGKKLRVSLEGMQCLISVKERVLNDIRGIFRMGDETDDRVVKPSLISRYQHTKGVLTAAETFRDEPAILVAHNQLPF